MRAVQRRPSAAPSTSGRSTAGAVLECSAPGAGVDKPLLLAGPEAVYARKEGRRGELAALTRRGKLQGGCREAAVLVEVHLRCLSRPVE